MIRTDGRQWPPSRLGEQWHRMWHATRERLVRDVEVVDGDQRYRFRCGTHMEFMRCMSLFTKEAGTCAWINREVQPGQVFYDIGANIGLYTILAARRTGEKGKVFAFEPHSANFTRLLENIAVNDFKDIVLPCNFALNDRSGFLPFNYMTSDAATSNSQLASTVGINDEQFQPQVTELKYAANVDSLIASSSILPAHHIKLDVDGNELPILQGMSDLLRGDQRPLSVQVEVNPRDKETVPPLMEQLGYELVDKNYTASGLKLIKRGGDPEDYSYNAIFRPRP